MPVLVAAEAMAALASKLAGQVKNYGVATRVELGVIAFAALLSVALLRGSAARALLLGILVEGVALLCFDTFGLRRAVKHLEQLRANGPAPFIDSATLEK